jgi:electron transport complex protein RnfG
MAKRESTFINMVLALFLVTLIAAGALGYVYDLTKVPIEKAKIEAKNKAIRSVLPEFDEIIDEFKVATTPGNDSLEFYPAYKNGSLVGMAIKTYTKKGFSGFISIMAGIDANGNISGYQVLEHGETPGLGSKMELWFKNSDKPKQTVLGKNPETTKFIVSKDGGDIDAITASTITSRAFLDALTRAYDSYKENKVEPNKTAQAVSN